ncbi:hypothetical protein K505DRAFT_234729, partial [Melanomma pulvis-pyrius CBS 109.77]
LGIFQVNMPLLYGEGEKAFLRLQDTILQCSQDQTLLAWDFEPQHRQRREDHDGVLATGLLATSPRSFKNCGKIVEIDRHGLHSKIRSYNGAHHRKRALA